MKLLMTPRAYWHLQWLCHRSENEVSCMGLLSAESEEFRIEEVVLVKQEVSTAHVELDMAWWADKQAELYEQQGVQPWQSSIWLHTHPAGINRPSATDDETMQESFGSWDFAVMLILTKEGYFYARLDFQHAFPGGGTVRFQVPLQVKVAWNQAEEPPITRETLALWEAEFQERVSEAARLWSYARKPREKKESEKQKDLLDSDSCLLNSGLKEVTDYADVCERHGLDPSDPTSYEAVFGYWPAPGDLELAGLCSLDEDGF